MKINHALSKESLSTKGIVFSSQNQEKIFKLLLNISKTVNSEIYKEHKKEFDIFINRYSLDGYAAPKDEKSFKAAVTSWLLNVFMKFDESELKAIKASAQKFKENKDYYGFIIECLNSIPKPKQVKERAPKEEKVAPTIQLTFDDLDL